MSGPERKDNEFKELVRICEEHLSRVGQDEKRGIFGIEAQAHERAKEVELSLIVEEIEKQDRGYEGNTRTCPNCGRKEQRYKGDAERVVKFECGTLTLTRSYYVCLHCNKSSYPLDEKLGLVEGREQGHLREKLSILGILVPYNQIPKLCRIFFDSENYAGSIRRLVLREAQRYDTAEVEHTTLEVTSSDTVYLQIDGHLCPTREEHRDEKDQGYREAKLILAFNEKDKAQVSEKRNELLNHILQGRIAPADEFIDDAQDIYRRANAVQAGRVVALADGAKWIWNLIDEVAPEAIQILDYAHAKSYLYDAAKIIYNSGSSLVKPWVAQQQDLLFDDNVTQVIENIKAFMERKPDLGKIVTYFENNQQRMLYGSYQQQGLNIGSGSIESAGKRMSHGRIKGCGMRWNIPDLNNVIALRCAFFDDSWINHWKQQYKIAA